MIVGVIYLSVFWSLVEVHSQPTVTISKSPSGAVCAGTELTLTSHIHLGNAGGNLYPDDLHGCYVRCHVDFLLIFLL